MNLDLVAPEGHRLRVLVYLITPKGNGENVERIQTLEINPEA